MYRSLFARDILAEWDRLQREMQEAFDLSPSIRGIGRGGFPALNVGGTPQSVEIYAFAPGLDPATMEVNLDRGLLTIAGERTPDLPSGGDDKAVVHINERFGGRFRREVFASPCRQHVHPLVLVALHHLCAVPGPRRGDRARGVGRQRGRVSRTEGDVAA